MPNFDELKPRFTIQRKPRGHTPNAGSLVPWLLFVSLFTLSPGAHSADETRPLEDFYEIRINVPHNVELVESEDTWVRLEGDSSSIEDIETEISDGILSITTEDGWFSWGKSGEVQLTVAYQELEAVSINGSSETYAAILASDDLRLTVAGSGDLEVSTVNSQDVLISILGSGNIEIEDLETRDLSTSVSGSGSIEISGKCTSQDLKISGSGDYQASNLRSKHAEVSILGSGDGEIWAQTQLDITIKGSGDLIYYGNPNVTRSVAGAGSIEQRAKEL